MAKRRELKKAISFLTGELLDELFVKVMLSEKELDENTVGALTGRIISESEALRSRVGKRLDRKDKQAYEKNIKAHFASIRSDWDKLVGDAWAEIEAL